MGMFSYTCAKTNLPYLNSPKWAKHPFSQAVVVRPGAPVTDAPSDLRNLADDLRTGRAKLVLKDHYDPSDGFESLGLSRNEPGQGHFHKPAFLKKLIELGPFASYEGYHLAWAGIVSAQAAARLSREQGETIMNVIGVMGHALARERVRSLPTDVIPANEVTSYHHITAKVVANKAGAVDKIDIVANMPGGMYQDTLGRMVLNEDGSTTPSFDEAAALIVRANPLKQVLDVMLVKDGEDIARVTRHDTGAGERLFIVEEPQMASKRMFADVFSLMAHYGVSRDNYLVSAQLDNFEPETVAPRLDIGIEPDFGFGSYGSEEDEEPGLPTP